MAEWITTGQVALPQSWRDFAGGTFDAGSYEWQVRTWDALGEPGPWSGSNFFDAATPPPGPIITAPANGETIGLRYAVVQWSTPNQDANELQRLVEPLVRGHPLRVLGLRQLRPLRLRGGPQDQESAHRWFSSWCGRVADATSPP